MTKTKWNIEAVKAYETGQGVELVNETYPHYVPKNGKPVYLGYFQSIEEAKTALRKAQE